MSISIYLGQFFGLYLVITSIALLINQKFYKKAISELVKSSSMHLVISIYTLILGLLFVIAHNMWVKSWVVIVTILCWIVLIKGIFMFFFPTYLPTMLKNMQTKYKINILDCIKWSTWICLFVGAYLLYLIYFRLPINPVITF